jgi:hypothetical protein
MDLRHAPSTAKLADLTARLCEENRQKQFTRKSQKFPFLEITTVASAVQLSASATSATFPPSALATAR